MNVLDPDRGPSDPRRIFETLSRHHVDYTTIGGIAVQAHGSTRTTRDVDIVAASDPENLERLAAALDELDARWWGVDADLLEIELDARILAEGGNVTFVTVAGGLDFFNEVRGGVPTFPTPVCASAPSSSRSAAFRSASRARTISSA